MWARVKGKKRKNTLLEMPFKAVYLFRPAYIQPLHGVSHEDGMVWHSLRCDEDLLSGIEDAIPELCDNNRVRRSRNAEG